MAAVPPKRFDDVVYFNAADHEWPIGFNLLTHSPHDARPRQADGIIECFRHLFSDSWGPRLEYLFKATLLTLLANQNVSLLGVARLLSDPVYRYWAQQRITDPQLRFFWGREFDRYGDRFEREAVSPIQNKVGPLLLDPVLRNIVGQVTSGFDLRFMMDRRRILVANLAKGAIGSTNANLLGSLLLTQLQLTAMQRRHRRTPFFVFVDEFGSLATDAFVDLLGEIRKYGIGLVLARQRLGHDRPGIDTAVLGNVGSHVAFRIGGHDAATMSREMGGPRDLSEFTELNNFQAFTRVLGDGDVMRLCEMSLHDPFELKRRKVSRLKKLSRQRFGTRRSVVEDRIERWFQNPF
ncbi:MAG: hypothetical protein AAF328_07325 [Planctomycetota bacterium]